MPTPTGIEGIITLEGLATFKGEADQRYATPSDIKSYGLSISGHTVSLVEGGANQSVTVPDADTRYTAASASPAMDGTAAVGTSAKYAREDHVHPTDTSRASASALSSHTGDATAHVTAAERASWNAKTSNTGTVTRVSTGIGLAGGDVTGSGTVKAKLKSETAHTASSATPTNAASRQYPVGVDKDGYLSVNVPWENTAQNQNAFSNVKVGGTTIAADAATDTLTVAAGANVTLTPDATNDKLTIAATDTTYSAGTDLALSGTTFGHGDSGVNAGTYGPDTAPPMVTTQVDGHMVSLSIPWFAVNARGHVTGAGENVRRATIPSASESVFGVVKPDSTSIVATGGVISVQMTDTAVDAAVAAAFA